MTAKANRKVSLTATFVKERLSFDRIPMVNDKGQVAKFEPNAEQKRYVIFDGHQDSPVGFGVAVNRTNMSYILQRRIGGRVLKATICDTRDMPLADARKKAMEVLAQMEATGKSPAEARVRSEDDILVAEMTLVECIAMYRKHLVERATPAKDSSLRGLEQAVRRLRRPGVQLADRKVGELVTEKRILDAFDALASGKRKLRDGTQRANEKSKAYDQPTTTTAELTFRWVSRAVDYCMTREARVAGNIGRDPSLRFNPFDVLKHEGKYRDRKALEEHYKNTGARNPMQIRDGSLGRFLDALWDRRKIDNYRTACDYLLLTLLWGTRRGEAAPLMWRHRLSDDEAKKLSWVDLKSGWVQFYDTKNRFTHRLPLAPGAKRVLTLREEAGRRSKSNWVFPARSSKAVQGHYLSSKAILQGLRERGGIEQLRTHDLRRTFATVAEEMTSYAVVKRLLNHKSLRDVTLSYAEVDDARLLEEMARVERAVLSNSPVVALALLPVETGAKT